MEDFGSRGYVPHDPVTQEYTIDSEESIVTSYTVNKEEADWEITMVDNGGYNHRLVLGLEDDSRIQLETLRFLKALFAF